MKKSIVFITAIVLISAMLLPSAAFAEKSATLSLISSVGENSVAPGDEFTVTLHIAGDYEVHAANISVDFDPLSLEFISADVCEFLKQSGAMTLPSDELAKDGHIKLVIAMPTDSLKGEGDLFAVKFKVKEGVKENQQVVLTVTEFNYLPIQELQPTPVSCITESAVINISGGTDPAYTFVPVEEGIRTPVPNMTDRPHPAVTPGPTAEPGKETAAPGKTVNTAAPGESAAPSSAPQDSANPDFTEDPGKPVSADVTTPAPDKDPGKKKKNDTAEIVILSVLGAIALAAIVVLLVTGKKKQGK